MESKATHCKKGHEYTPDNVYTGGGGGMRCKICAGKVTHCKNGHGFTPENTALYSGKRRCRICRRKTQTAFKARNRTAWQKYYYLRYGMTLSDYDTMLEEQSGRCAICMEQRAGNRLSVDHCHSTGKVRGILCPRCNSGLGHFRDNCMVMEAAIEYLRKHGSK